MRPVLPLRFETIQVLRESKTSSTFVATDHQLARNNVVVKAIRKGHFTQELPKVIETCAWFRGLHHPHISTILDAGLTPKGDLFCVRDFAQPTEMFVKKDMDLLNVFLGAVEFLHSVGRVHGSIRPSNVFATADAVQLADPWMPQPTAQPETEEDVRFTAPEVLKGHPRTIESDLYSVGALLYRFLSGRDLFDDSDLETLTSRYIWAAPRSLTSISYVSRTIADIVENLIHKDPTHRKPAFESLKHELRFEPKPATRAPAFGMDEPLEKAEQFLQPNPERLRVLLIEAPIGFGKTRFLEELRHRMAFTEPKLVFSTCPPVGRSAYITLAKWVLSLHDRFCSSFDDPSVKRLQTLLDDTQDAALPYKTDRMTQDLLDVFGLIEQKTSLVLLIEDIDRTNKANPLVQLLLTRGGRLATCLVLTAGAGEIRSEMIRAIVDSAVANFRALPLRPLGALFTKAMVSALEVDPDRQSSIQEKAAGNPMFVEEYAKDPKSKVPPVIKRTISKLVGELPKEARNVVEALSLFEGPVRRDLVCKTVGISEEQFTHQLMVLEQAGLFFEALEIQQSVVWAYIHSQIPRARRVRMHASYYDLLKGADTADTALARHAYLGGLFEEAGKLNLELARAAYRVRDYKATAGFYAVAEECLKRCSGRGLEDVDDIVSFARSLGILGNARPARAKLTALLEAEEVQSSPEALASVYAAVGSVYLEPSNTERVRLTKLAISLLPSGDPALRKRYLILADILMRDGRVEEAEAALQTMDEYGTADDPDGVGVRAMLLLCRARFSEAVNLLFRSTPTAAFPSAWRKSNLAVSLEILGDVREARQLQMEALDEADAQGISPNAILCLGNLASMETKLGNIAKAEACLQQAFSRLDTLHRKESGIRDLPSCYSDAATHWLERGNLRRSAYYLDRLNRFENGGYHHEAFQFCIVRCEYYLALGQLDQAARSLNESHSFGSNGGLFDVERLLIQARLVAPSRGVVEDLREASETSKRLETKYQRCRVLVALARSLCALSDFPGAWSEANEALELAQRGGYRVLAGQALLQRGIAEDSAAHKLSDFLRCIQEAASMDLQPLFAQCAFQIGAWRTSCEDYSAAQDYLHRSVTITSRIAEGLSLANRKRFLAMPAHREARRLLENATARSTEFFSLLKEPLGKEDLLLRALYRLASALRSARDKTTAVSILVESLRQCIALPGVVLLQDGTGLVMLPTIDVASDEMKQRAVRAFKSGARRTDLVPTWNDGTDGAGIFVPIPCAGTRAGIYVERPPGSSPPGDQEIQFLTVAAAVAGTVLHQESETRQETAAAHENNGIVGVSEIMKKVFAEVEIAARNSATVLIEGESGTGKELVAKAIHSRSSRTAGPFVAVDCGALPENLIETELFGTRKGAFTDAGADRQGLFESANQGTIFLDEIGNASPALQTKLLRVLQEREIRRVGDTKGRPIDVRLITATNCSLEKLVEDGKFRQDLLFRLKVLHVQLPPLRKRKEDIPLLANAFLKHLNLTNQTEKAFAVGVLSKLAEYEFRGNVRELQNAIERSFYACEGQLITQISVHADRDSEMELGTEAERWLQDLSDGKRTFWSSVRDRYKRRDISRERVLALVDLGLKSTQGNYKAVAAMFKIEPGDYRRFMDFLRRNDCLLDFRPYRKSDDASTFRGK